MKHKDVHFQCFLQHAPKWQKCVNLCLSHLLNKINSKKLLIINDMISLTQVSILFLCVTFTCSLETGSWPCAPSWPSRTVVYRRLRRLEGMGT